MAVTKLMHMKESPGKNPSAHLLNAIEYVLDIQNGRNQEKTLDGFLIGGNSGVDASTIYETMMNTKLRFNKN